MYSDGHYHQTLGYLHAQFGNADQACTSYRTAIEVFQRNHDAAAVAKLETRLNELNHEVAPSAVETAEPSLHVQLKLDILRLCRLGLRHSQRHQYQVALKLLERCLQLSDALTEIDPQQGQYCAAIALGMMGKIYTAQRYYLFALASFKAALEAYQCLQTPDQQTQDRMATVMYEIAHIAEITHHPDVAIEYYLDALWHWNKIGQQPQAKQVVQQLNKLCDRPEPAKAQAKQ